MVPSMILSPILGISISTFAILVLFNWVYF
jgi:hypothetical protein